MAYLYLRQESRLGFFGEDVGIQQVNGLGAPVVTPGKGPDEIIVTRDNGTRYCVRRKVRAQVLTRPGRLRTGFCWDDKRVYGRLTWCQGTQGTIDVGANLPDAAKRLLNTVIDQWKRGERPEDIARTLENAQVETFVQLAITKDRAWRFTGDFKLELSPSRIVSKSAAVSFDKGQFKVGAEYKDDGTGKQVLVTVDVLLGKRTVRGKPCLEAEIALWWDAECLREVPTKVSYHIPGCRPIEETLYLYFEHARDILRRDQKMITESANVVNEILKSNPKLGTALLNKRTLQRLDYLVGQGYWLKSVSGYTSPEGLRKESKLWEGNDELSKKRAEKVLKLIKARYYGERAKTFQMRLPAGVGLSEFPKLDKRPGVELKDPMLDRVMIHGGVKLQCNPKAQDENKPLGKAPFGSFVDQCPQELARMTEEDCKYVTDSRLTDRRRAERLFENLRRVEIHLSHCEKLRSGEFPDVELVHEHACPADVIEAAERKWGSRIPFTKPDQPVCG